MPRLANTPDLSQLVAPVDPSLPSAPQIAPALRDVILSMDLAPGRPLSESRLAEAFGSSRTPVREALAQLQSEGLVTRLPNRGTFVSRLGRSATIDAQFIREALELAIVRRLCETGIPQDADRSLRRNLDAQAASIDAGSWRDFADCDNAFHIELALATGRSRSADLVRRERATLDRLRYMRQRQQHELEGLLSEHKTILEAIARGDAAAAEAVMRNHLRHVLATLDQVARDRSDLFED